MHTILIADPRYVMRTGLSAVFSNDPFVQSIKEASTPEDVQRHWLLFTRILFLFINRFWVICACCKKLLTLY